MSPDQKEPSEKKKNDAPLEVDILDEKDLLTATKWPATVQWLLLAPPFQGVFR